MPQAAEPQILIDEDDHMLCVRPGSDTLTVYFAALNVPRRQFNFLNLGRALPGNVLFLNDLSQRWYLHGVAGLGRDLDALIAAVGGHAQALGATRIRAVGASMGGFGALLMTRIPGCAALAFSPECRLGQPGSRSAKGFEGAIPAEQCDLRAHMAQTEAQATVVFGESEPMDVWAASQFQDLAGVEIIGLRGVDHYAATHMNQAGVLGPAIERFMASGRLDDLDSLKPAPRSDGAWRNLAGTGQALGVAGYAPALLKAHLATERAAWSEAHRHASRAVELHSDSDEAWRLLGRALLALGRPRDALGPLSTCLMLAERDPLTRYCLGNAFRKLGLHSEARRHQEVVIRRWPDFGRAYYELSLLDQAKGDIQGAIAHLRKGVEMEPRRTLLHEKLKALTEDVAPPADR